MELKTATLNDKRIAYCTSTQFMVQVGRYTKGAYKTRHCFVGNLAMAVAYYNAINIGNGYKKRLFMPSSPKPVLAHQFS